MKKVFFVLLALIAVAVITCPKKEDHSEAIMKNVRTVIDKELAKDNSSLTEMGLNFIGSAIGSSVVEYILENKLSVDNYFVCSLGKFELEDKTQIVSVGVFGHIFTDIPDEVKQYLNEK